jgi:hypothetical protein
MSAFPKERPTYCAATIPTARQRNDAKDRFRIHAPQQTDVLFDHLVGKHAPAHSGTPLSEDPHSAASRLITRPRAVHSENEKVGILHLSAVFDGEIVGQWPA